jgi:hypothetical protein
MSYSMNLFAVWHKLAPELATYTKTSVIPRKSAALFVASRRWMQDLEQRNAHATLNGTWPAARSGTKELK